MIFVGVLFTAFSCSPTRRLKADEKLLIKNHIVEVDGKKKDEDIASFVQPKPNRKFLGFWRLYLQIYNLPNPEKLEVKKQKQLVKLDQKNREIQEYNNTVSNPKKKKKFKKERLLFGEWLQKIGEKPSLTSPYITNQTTSQISKQLKNKGYFFAEVQDSITYGKPLSKNQLKIKEAEYKTLDSAAQVQMDSLIAKTARKKVKLGDTAKAYVYFFIKRDVPYFLSKDSIEIEIEDTAINQIVQSVKSRSLIVPGMQFDVDKMDEERERLVNVIQARGYYLFRKDFIVFEADTTKGNRTVGLKLIIKNPDIKYLVGKDTVLVNRHKVFKVNDIYVFTNYSMQDSLNHYNLSKSEEDYVFKYRDELNYSSKVIARAIYFNKGNNYSKWQENVTREMLNDLRNFRYVNVRYEPVFTNENFDSLRTFVELAPLTKQNISVSFQGTRTDLSLGASASLGYLNRNIFKGAEILEFRINGGADIQVPQGNITITGQNSPVLGAFNTLEAGAQLSLTTPRFLFPIKLSKVKKRSTPKTVISLNYNYQQRIDYSRHIGSFFFGYTWRQLTSEKRMRTLIKKAQSTGEWYQTAFKTHNVNVAEISIVQASLSDEFRHYIDSINDNFVKNSFQSQYIQASSYTFTLETPIRKNNKFYFRFNAQVGGNLLYLFYNVAKAERDTFGYNSNGPILRYELGNIPFAQYARTDFDFRYYRHFGTKRNHSLNFRMYAGVAVPFGNSIAIPFEKSFFIGGANDMRAWLPRTLGPGGYSDPNANKGRVDQIGDVKLLGMIEYRFKVYRFFELAVFMDAGNIWLLNDESVTERPDAQFKLDRFYKQFALDAGVGVRLNFTYFIFRLDWAVPLRDPSKVNPWVVTNPSVYDVIDETTNKVTSRPFWTHFNIGIGYPF